MTSNGGKTGVLRRKLHQAEQLAHAATLACERAQALLEDVLQGGFEQGFKCDSEPTEHRREHRPGRAPRIDTAPALQAFIEARMDRLTFTEIAAKVAARFPPNRRVGKSAIHAWWQRRRKAR